MTSMDIEPKRGRVTGINRRAVLRGVAVGGGALAFGVPTFSNQVSAGAASIQTCGVVDIVVAIDTSGSLNGTEIQQLQSGTNQLIAGLAALGDSGSDVKIGSLQFGDNAISDVQPLTTNGPTVSLPSVGFGNTPMSAALDIADQLVNDTSSGARSDAEKIVLLLTDGGPNYINQQYTANGFVAPRNQTTDWSAVGGNTTYDNGTASLPNSIVTEEEMDETRLVAGSVRAGGTRIITVFASDDEVQAMNSAAVNAYTNLPTYLATHIASPGSAINSDTSSIAGLLDELTTILADLCAECEECPPDSLRVKYEFENGDFSLEGEGDNGIRYTPNSFVSKDGQTGEPIEVTFDTDYCELWAVVKTGQVLDVQELEGPGFVTAVAPDKYAISFVEFYCTETEAEEAADSFPSNRENPGRPNR